MSLAFQIPPDADLDAFEKQVAAHQVKTERKKDPEPSVTDMVTFADPKGTTMQVFKRDAFSHQKFTHKGIVPFKLGHVAFHVTDVKHVTKFYCDVLGFRESDWMADFFSFLRCGSDHHTINLMETGSNRHFHTAFELRDWGHMHEACDFLSLNGYKLLWGPGRHGIGHNLFAYHRAPNGLITETFCRARPHERGTRLFRTAALAPRQSAATQSVGEGSFRLESLGHDAGRRNDAITIWWADARRS